MLIDSDFVRHGFQLSPKVITNNKLYTKKFNRIKQFELQVENLRKNVQKVDLAIDGEHLVTEFMWSPEQLRQFIVKHCDAITKSK